MHMSTCVCERARACVGEKLAQKCACERSIGACLRVCVNERVCVCMSLLVCGACAGACVHVCVRDTSFLLVFDIFVVVVFIWRARAAFVNMLIGLGVCEREQSGRASLCPPSLLPQTPAAVAPLVVVVTVLVESV